MIQPQNDRPWQPTGKTIEKLGVSRDWLYSMLPYWRLNYHWRNIQRPTATLPRYQWHIRHIEEWLEKKASERG